ncbi:MAG: RdgB/HAM1 family non-canonical purine NTP pyrophosphatase [Bacteroidota bacterium]
MRVCFASHNANKIAELNELLGGKHEVIGLADLGITEDIAETGVTFEENSRIKASYVFEKEGIPVFADDTGLCVDALDSAPGVYSARYAGPEKDDQRNIDLLLQRMAGKVNRSASFITVITFLDERGRETQFRGTVEGKLLTERRGKQGFGYDPIFQPLGHDISFGEMDSVAKNKISHRGKAVQQLIEYLKNYE